MSTINPKSRPNKLALGMTRTWERTKDRLRPIGTPRAQLSDDALSLVVKGTNDKLTWMHHHYYTQRVDAKPCQCCGHVRKVWRLNDKGRRKLATMRKKCEPAKSWLYDLI